MPSAQRSAVARSPHIITPLHHAAFLQNPGRWQESDGRLATEKTCGFFLSLVPNVAIAFLPVFFPSGEAFVLFFLFLRYLFFSGRFIYYVAPLVSHFTEHRGLSINMQTFPPSLHRCRGPWWTCVLRQSCSIIQFSISRLFKRKKTKTSLDTVGSCVENSKGSSWLSPSKSQTVTVNHEPDVASVRPHEAAKTDPSD